MRYDIRGDSKSAIAAAMVRVGTYGIPGQIGFETDAAWHQAEVRLDDKGYIAWRVMDLGQQLFLCLGEAQNWRCCYCGVRMTDESGSADQATIEHVIPKGLGGQDHPDNMVVCCTRCNCIRS